MRKLHDVQDVKESEDSIAFRNLMMASGSKRLRIKKKKELQDAINDAIEKWFQDNVLYEFKIDPKIIVRSNRR